MTHDERSAIEDAYGMLWLVVTTDRRIHEARKRLLSLIDKDGQRRGIQVAKNIFGPTTEAEIVNIDTPPPQPHVEPVQDTWFTDRSLPVMAISGDVESDRVLKLHFRRPVSDEDRKAITDALNMHQRSLSDPAPAASIYQQQTMFGGDE
jgi:hypothetical protein